MTILANIFNDNKQILAGFLLTNGGECGGHAINCNHSFHAGLLVRSALIGPVGMPRSYALNVTPT